MQKLQGDASFGRADNLTRINDFQSALKENEKALILCYEQIEIMQDEIMQNQCGDLSGEIGRLEHALKERKKSVAGCQQKLNHQEGEIQRLKDQIAVLEAQIEEYKTIDLHIEKKKQR